MREETRRAATVKGSGVYRTRLASGEKQGRKRMATLGVVYDTDPAPRRPHDVLTPAITLRAAPDGDRGDRPRRKGPTATAKWLVGSIATTSQQVIAQVFDQANQRDPTHRRRWIVLVDGARHQLELIQAEAARRKVAIHILVDFIHVLEYIWKAAWCLLQDADPAAEPWVATHALRILAGEVDAVIAALKRQATDAGLSTRQRGGIDSCIGYLQAKREFLDYKAALTAGWPIATGVIEGACRHLVGDRLDITGARWGLQGAEAVLKLRALCSNGDFDAYWRFHVRREAPRIRAGMKGPHRCLVAARQ